MEVEEIVLVITDCMACRRRGSSEDAGGWRSATTTAATTASTTIRQWPQSTLVFQKQLAYILKINSYHNYSLNDIPECHFLSSSPQPTLQLSGLHRWHFQPTGDIHAKNYTSTIVSPRKASWTRLYHVQNKREFNVQNDISNVRLER